MGKQCERCGVPAEDTQEGFLAYNGSRLVCSDCDSDLTNEWCADTGNAHPLDVFTPPPVERVWYPHLDYAGEPMERGHFRDPVRS